MVIEAPWFLLDQPVYHRNSTLQNIVNPLIDLLTFDFNYSQVLRYAPLLYWTLIFFFISTRCTGTCSEGKEKIKHACIGTYHVYMSFPPGTWKITHVLSILFPYKMFGNISYELRNYMPDRVEERASLELVTTGEGELVHGGSQTTH
jgi:hypothetical protein